MAVARMATADYNSVRASLKSAENEHRVYSARAGNTDDFDIGGVIQAVISRKVCSRI